MADVYFMCSCKKNIAVDEIGVGSTVHCPDCGQALQVPEPEIGWVHVACGTELTAPMSMAGQLVQCLNCKGNTLVPVKNTETSQRRRIAAPRLARWGQPPPAKVF